MSSFINNVLCSMCSRSKVSAGRGIKCLYKVALLVLHKWSAIKMWGAIKLQAFILCGLPLTCALTGSIKSQIDFTYQCSHCLTWRSSYVVHVCLIMEVLTGSQCMGPASQITYSSSRKSLCSRSWTISALLCLVVCFFVFFLGFNKSDTNCLQRKN